MERAIDEINKGKEAHVVSAFRLNLSNAIKKILKKLFVIYTISNNKKMKKKRQRTFKNFIELFGVKSLPEMKRSWVKEENKKIVYLAIFLLKKKLLNLGIT